MKGRSVTEIQCKSFTASTALHICLTAEKYSLCYVQCVKRNSKCVMYIVQCTIDWTVYKDCIVTTLHNVAYTIRRIINNVTIRGYCTRNVNRMDSKLSMCS